MAGTNPRAARIAALIQRVVASSIERELHDKRLASITVTEVRVTNDLQIAKVYWTQLGHEGHEEGERKRAQQALDQAKGHLRSLVGHKAGLRLTPQLQFVFDEVPGEAHEIEDILAVAKKRDEELARDLGNELGVGGYLTRLRRTRVGRFALPDDTSGLIASEAMLDTRTHTVTAHTDQKTFTNREGQTVTRNKCVLNTPEGLAGDERRNWLLDHALTMEQAARGAMPALDITPEEASELRFGRRIERTISEPTAAIVPQTHDVAAIIERANAHQAKPVTVFPLA